MQHSVWLRKRAWHAREHAPAPLFVHWPQKLETLGEPVLTRGTITGRRRPAPWRTPQRNQASTYSSHGTHKKPLQQQVHREVWDVPGPKRQSTKSHHKTSQNGLCCAACVENCENEKPENLVQKCLSLLGCTCTRTGISCHKYSNTNTNSIRCVFRCLRR